MAPHRAAGRSSPGGLKETGKAHHFIKQKPGRIFSTVPFLKLSLDICCPPCYNYWVNQVERYFVLTGAPMAAHGRYFYRSLFFGKGWFCCGVYRAWAKYRLRFIFYSVKRRCLLLALRICLSIRRYGIRKYG